MTQTMSRVHLNRVRAPQYRPHVRKGAPEFFAKLAGYDTSKAAQLCMDRVQKALPQIAAAFHLAHDAQGLGRWAASFDAARKIGGTPLPLDTCALCRINGDLLRASGSLTEFVADRSEDERADMLKHMKRAVIELSEAIASAEAV